ncbi:hypothetical protein CEXT_756971 [Caerostris extrusa]|uniref:Uncharacterized protein n=1 Tax=Caerostris extrusa TaxID=172846 RepID=A0AAV4PMI3_CAEEX|nr:hypothetical protein CEXT_756971 [Caerostris extrusa]
MIDSDWQNITKVNCFIILRETTQIKTGREISHREQFNDLEKMGVAENPNQPPHRQWPEEEKSLSVALLCVVAHGCEQSKG